MQVLVDYLIQKSKANNINQIKLWVIKDPIHDLEVTRHFVEV